MRVMISKKFSFDAAHRLPKVAEDHKCFRLHGHSYWVEVLCAGELDARGMVCDYAEIAEAWMKVHDVIDHRYLNEIPGLENPTTEVLAPWILWKLDDLLPTLVGIRVFESDSTYCEARKP